MAPLAAFTPASALPIHSGTASLQSSAAKVVSGGDHSAPSSMMHGGMASEHFFRQTFKQAYNGVFSGPPHSSDTLEWYTAMPPSQLAHISAT